MINIKLVKKIRKNTGISLVKCKSALERNDWEYKKTIEWIKKNDLVINNKKDISILKKENIITKIKKNINIIAIVKTENDFTLKGNVFFNKALEIATNAKLYCDNNMLKYMKNSLLKSIFLNDLIKKYNDISREEIMLKKVDIIAIKEGIGRLYIHKKLAINIGINATIIFLGKNNLKEKRREILMQISASNLVSIDTEGICKFVINHQINILRAIYIKKKETKLEIELFIRKKIINLFTKVILYEQLYILNYKEIVGGIIKRSNIERFLFCYKKYKNDEL